MLRKLAALTSAAVLLAAVPVGTARAIEPPPLNQWLTIKETIVLPAGTACTHTIIEKARGKLRVTQQANGTFFVDYKNWSHSKFRNRSKHKSYRVPAGGDAVIRPSADGKDLDVVAWGANYLQGRGVYGILWTKGPISLTLTDAETSGEATVRLDLARVKRTKQICYKLGSKPVWGKTLMPSA